MSGAALALAVGSLFSGIGGLDLGLERAGMRVVWQVERDLYARKVLRQHWPRARLWADVTQVGAAQLPYVDVLCGGFPCQDISPANPRGLGLDGARSGLWGHFRRIIGEVRPVFPLIENNGQNRGRWLPRVLGDLASLGYDAEWHCVPAAYVGAPHLRDRCFVIGYPGGFGVPDADAAHRTGDRSAVRVRAALTGPGQSGDAGSDLGALPLLPGLGGVAVPTPRAARCDVPVPSEGRGWAEPLQFASQWAAEPAVGRVAHGVPARMDRLRCLGNAVVPQVAELLGGRIAALAAQFAGQVTTWRAEATHG